MDMFLPQSNRNEAESERKAAYRRIEDWSKKLLGPDSSVEEACMVSVQEVQCGDPQCSPIDTVVTLMFDSKRQGFIGLPMEAKEVKMEDLKEYFPPQDVIDKWYRGEDVAWPPEPEPVELRFTVGTEVLCRVGPQQWAEGTVEQLWYRQPNWEEGVYAPYKIKLSDGKSIYAPQDVDPVIRLNPDRIQPSTVNE